MFSQEKVEKIHNVLHILTVSTKLNSRIKFMPVHFLAKPDASVTATFDFWGSCSELQYAQRRETKGHTLFEVLTNFRVFSDGKKGRRIAFMHLTPGP